MERLIGELRGSNPGPTVICIGGMHGSEPAGVHAAERFIEVMASRRSAVAGRFVAIRGNLGALSRRIRYVDRDLNRMWDDATVDTLANGAGTGNGIAELGEMRVVHEILQRAIAEADRPICVVDLHTTSSLSAPFLWLVPSVGARHLLPKYGLPIVHDPVERIAQPLGYYVASIGQKIVVAEGGQHDAAESVDHLEAILWITCVQHGLLPSNEVAHEYHRSTELLRQRGGDIPTLYEVVHHHKVTEGDGFEMLSGYESFQPVNLDESLAEDTSGTIRAHRPGRILMPLYRPPCDDGFMIIEERLEWPAAEP